MPRLPAAMLAGLIGTVLSACAANPPASNPAPTAATTPTPALAYAHSDPHSQITNENLAPWFLEARDLVSRNLQVDLSSVVATVASAEQIASQARTSLLGALSHDLANNDFAESLVDNILSAQTASVLAIYSPQRQSILLHRSNLQDYLAANGPDVTTKSSIQALLIHELIHAADDVRYNAFNRKGASYQEVFAKSTIIEGHAQWQTPHVPTEKHPSIYTPPSNFFPEVIPRPTAAVTEPWTCKTLTLGQHPPSRRYGHCVLVWRIASVHDRPRTHAPTEAALFG